MTPYIRKVIEAHHAALEQATDGNIATGKADEKGLAVAREALSFASSLLDNTITEIEADAYVFAGALSDNDKRLEVSQEHLEMTAYGLCDRLNIIRKAWRLMEDARHVLKQANREDAA